MAASSEDWASSSLVVIEQLMEDDPPSEIAQSASVIKEEAHYIESDKSITKVDIDEPSATVEDTDAPPADDFDDDDDSDSWESGSDDGWGNEEVVELDPSGVLPPELQDRVNQAVALDMLVDPAMKAFVDKKLEEQAEHKESAKFRSWMCDLCESFNDATLFDCGKPFCKGRRDVTKGFLDVEPQYGDHRSSFKKPSIMDVNQEVDDADADWERGQTAGEYDRLPPVKSDESASCVCQALGEFSDRFETDIDDEGRFKVWICPRCSCMNWRHWCYCRICIFEPRKFNDTTVRSSDASAAGSSSIIGDDELGVHVFASMSSPASQDESQLSPILWLKYHWPTCPFRMAAGVDEKGSFDPWVGDDRFMDGGIDEDGAMENVSAAEIERQRSILQMFRYKKSQSGYGAFDDESVRRRGKSSKPYKWYIRDHFDGKSARLKRRGILNSFKLVFYSPLDYPKEIDASVFHDKLLIEFGEPYRLWYAINAPRVWKLFNYVGNNVSCSDSSSSSLFVGEIEDEKVADEIKAGGLIKYNTHSKIASKTEECTIIEDYPLFMNVHNYRHNRYGSDEKMDEAVPGTSTELVSPGADDIAGESGIGDGLELAIDSQISGIDIASVEPVVKSEEKQEKDPMMKQKFVSIKKEDLIKVSEPDTELSELDDRPFLPRMMSIDPYTGWLAGCDGRTVYVFCTDQSQALFPDLSDQSESVGIDLDEPGMSELIKLKKWHKQLKPEGYYLFGYYDIKKMLNEDLVGDEEWDQSDYFTFRLRFRNNRILIMATPLRLFHEFIIDLNWKESGIGAPIYYHRTVRCSGTDEDYLQKSGCYDFDFHLQYNNVDSDQPTMVIYTLFKRWIGLWNVLVEYSLDELREHHQSLLGLVGLIVSDEDCALNYADLLWVYAVGFTQAIGSVNKVYSFEICFHDLSDSTQVTMDSGLKKGSIITNKDYYNTTDGIAAKSKKIDSFYTKQTICNVNASSHRYQYYTDRGMSTEDFETNGIAVCRTHSNWLYLMTITGDIIMVHPTNIFFEYLCSQNECEPLIPFAASKQFGTFALYKPQLYTGYNDDPSKVTSVTLQQSASHCVDRSVLNRWGGSEKDPVRINLAEVFGENGEIANILYDETWGVSGRLLVYGRIDESSKPKEKEASPSLVPGYGGRAGGAVIVSALDTPGMDEESAAEVAKSSKIVRNDASKFGLKILYSQSDLQPLIQAIKDDYWFAPTAEIDGRTKFVSLVDGLGTPCHSRIIIAVYTFLYGDNFVSRLYAEIACVQSGKTTRYE